MFELLANLLLPSQDGRDFLLDRAGRGSWRGGLQERQVGLNLPLKTLSTSGSTGTPGFEPLTRVNVERPAHRQTYHP